MTTHDQATGSVLSAAYREGLFAASNPYRQPGPVRAWRAGWDWAKQGGDEGMSLTTDPHDGCLHETGPDGQQRCYLVLPDGARRELVRPVRRTYRHERCGSETTMAGPLAETYAAQPGFYGATFCVACRAHFPVGAQGQFVWLDGTKVGT